MDNMNYHTTILEDDNQESTTGRRRIYSIQIGDSWIKIQFSRNGKTFTVNLDELLRKLNHKASRFDDDKACLDHELKKRFGKDFMVMPMYEKWSISLFTEVVARIMQLGQAFNGTDMTADSLQRRDVERLLETVVDSYGNAVLASEAKLVKINADDETYILHVDEATQHANFVFGPIAIYGIPDELAP